jgi:hypothetical protein
MLGIKKDLQEKKEAVTKKKKPRPDDGKRSHDPTKPRRRNANCPSERDKRK